MKLVKLDLKKGFYPEKLVRCKVESRYTLLLRLWKPIVGLVDCLASSIVCNVIEGNIGNRVVFSFVGNAEVLMLFNLHKGVFTSV